MSRPWSASAARRLAVLLAAPSGLSGCAEKGGARASAWGGTVDTLASGQIVVSNPRTGAWGEGQGWTVTEDLRIGAVDDPGPYQLGRVRALDVDDYGRIWALDAQANEIRVFARDGHHVRTVGREGGGPGEFTGPAHMEFGPDGRLWVPDPQNNRVSVIDTTGAFGDSRRMEGGFYVSPWPGGFDRDGFYYSPIPFDYGDGEFGIALIRLGRDFAPVDTLPDLRSPITRDAFELRDEEGGGLIASVPYSPGFRTARSPRGTTWGLLTGPYRFFEVDADGDTVRSIEASFDPIPVTADDREAAVEELSWFTDQGGRVDPSRIPDTKPAAWSLFVDDADHVWVDRVSSNPGGQDFDVFDPTGRLLGRVTLPWPLGGVRRVVGDRIYGVTSDDLGVQYIVRGTIHRGG